MSKVSKISTDPMVLLGGMVAAIFLVVVTAMQ